MFMLTMLQNIFQGREVNYFATYEYCNKADEFYATEEMIFKNHVAMRNAYFDLIELLV